MANTLTRRGFIGTGTIMTALSYSRIQGANDRVGLGFIGVGNRGEQVHRSFLELSDCTTVAVSDLREDYMDLAVKQAGGTPKRYSNYRELLDNKDVDATVICTPDHWHALMFIDSCRAGKDVYVEKPLSLTVVEGRRMVEVSRETKRVTQVGIQRRSSPFLFEAVDLVRAGEIGHVSVAKGFHIQNEWPVGIGVAKDTKAPNEWEWEHWLGPAPEVPYNENRMYYYFRWFYNYSGGQLTNFGVHYLDMIRWCLGQQSPSAVVAMGGHFAGIEDNREIPDTLEVHWEYGGPTMVGFTQYNGNGQPANPNAAEMELRGTKGTLYLYWNRWEIIPEAVPKVEFGVRDPLDRASGRRHNASKRPVIEPRSREGSLSTKAHARNFLDCVKSRAECNCDVLTGHISTSAALIANIAYRTKQYLAWDPQGERFTNSSDANKFLHYSYRSPYVLD